MKPIELRPDPPPMALEAAQRFSAIEIEQLQAFLVWHRQKLMARRHRDRRCVECGHPRGSHSPKTSRRCQTCQAYRRERLKKMVVSCVLTEDS